MEEIITIQNKTNQLLNEIGMTLPQLFYCLGKNKSSLLNLDDISQKEFSEIYNNLSKGVVDKQSKGQLLEDLANLLFREESERFFYTRKNCRTSTNEIDLLLEWSDEARAIGINTMYPYLGDSFICECKNYDGPVNVTYVGKFCSLLTVTSTNFGIMIAWDGVTGRGKWDASQGLIKKIALSQKIFIIVLDKNDLKGISDGKTNIFALVHEKYIALKNDIDYTRYIHKHGAESLWEI